MYDDILGPSDDGPKLKKKTKFRKGHELQPKPTGSVSSGTGSVSSSSETCEDCGHVLDDCDCFDDEDDDGGCIGVGVLKDADHCDDCDDCWDAGGEIEPSQDINNLDACVSYRNGVAIVSDCKICRMYCSKSGVYGKNSLYQLSLVKIANDEQTLKELTKAGMIDPEDPCDGSNCKDCKEDCMYNMI